MSTGFVYLEGCGTPDLVGGGEDELSSTELLREKCRTVHNLDISIKIVGVGSPVLKLVDLGKSEAPVVKSKGGIMWS